MYEFESKCKILSGVSALESIPFELTSRKVSNPMILTEAIVEKIGFLKQIQKAFNYGNISTRSFYTKLPDVANVEILEKLHEKYTNEQCDSIIAIGRNAVINIAKALKYMINTETSKVKDLKTCEARVEKTVLIVVPVFLGCSEEASTRIKFYDLKLGKTYQIQSVLAQTNVVIIDKRMIDVLPHNLIVDASLYALAISLMSYVASDANCVTRVYATTAIKIIIDNLAKGCSNPKKKKALVPLVEAMVYAGIAKSETNISIIDILSRTISQLKQIPFERVYNAFFYVLIDDLLNKPEVKPLLIETIGLQGFIDIDDQYRTAELSKSIKNFVNKVTGSYAPYSLEKIGVVRSDFQKIVEKANFDVDTKKLDSEFDISMLYDMLNRCIN